MDKPLKLKVHESVAENTKYVDLDEEFIRFGQMLDRMRHDLTVPPALADYALRYGAKKERDGRWFYIGAVPNELLCFIDQRRLQPVVSFLPKDVKYCPHCGAEMVIRRRREKRSFQGLLQTNSGNSEFWGCTSYPACTKTLPLKKSDTEMREVQKVVVDKQAIAELSKYALSVLGGPNAVDRWMFTPMIAFGRRKPVDFLFSEKGRSRIRSLLDSIRFTTR